MITTIRRIVVTAAAIIAAGLLFANVYNSIVDAPNWGSNIPTSLEAARGYFTVRDPGDFYRYFSPANQIVTLLALILVWPLGWRTRSLTFAALLYLGRQRRDDVRIFLSEKRDNVQRAIPAECAGPKGRVERLVDDELGPLGACLRERDPRSRSAFQGLKGKLNDLPGGLVL